MSDGRRRHRLALAFCAWHVALTGCAKSPPATTFPVANPPASAAALDPLAALRQDIAADMQRAGVRRGTWGIAIRSLDRDERLFEANPGTLLVPASSAKLLSVAAAAEAVGWDYRFETTLRTNGTIANGVLSGDLIVVGSGDPSIGGRAGDGLAAWAEALRARGIRRIEGRVIGDDDAIEEPRPALAWAWDDIGYAYGSIFGALNLAENRMTVTVTPGAGAGAETSLAVDRVGERRPLRNRTITGSAGSPTLIWPEQQPGEPSLTIAGSIAAGSQPARLSVSSGNPTFWFASALRETLIDAHIEITGDAYDIDDLLPKPAPAALVLHTHRSRPLSEIVKPLLKDSINLYAEAVMRLNAASGTVPTNDAALAGLNQRLAAWGLAPDGQQIIDGSGLSRRDVVAADTLVAVLARMNDRSGASPWMTALPVAGVDGTLAGRMKGTPAEGNVRAKTGSMSNIRALAGYVTTRDGEHLAFAIIVNNFEGSGTQANEAIDAIAVRLAGFRRAS